MKYKENRSNQMKKKEVKHKKNDKRTMNTRTERLTVVHRKEFDRKQQVRKVNKIEYQPENIQQNKIEKSTQCVVIGGGAAGMMAAITAAQQGIRVILLEHTARLGSKILQTGNGKCNFTNLKMDSSMYQNDNLSFVKKVLCQFTVEDTLEFFQNIGVYYKEKNGYVYPHSETATSVQEALRERVEALGIEIIYFCDTKEIYHDESGYRLECVYKQEKDGVQQTKKDKRKLEDSDYIQFACVIHTDTLILATGSQAAPKSGSDGSGYELAKQLKHTIRTPLPALVQLVSDHNLCKVMAGVRSNGTVSIYSQGKCIALDTGELQYTDYGISGIPVFQVSHYAVHNIAHHRLVEARIDMLPDFTMEQLKASVNKRMKYEQDKTVESFFSGLLNRKLVKALIIQSKMKETCIVRECSLEDIYALLQLMKDFRMNLIGYKDFAYAQVCQGGVSLEEIHEETMESKLHKGLYFAGELTDVDGKCGGYNLQWAWSSGYVAGMHAAADAKNILMEELC